MAYLSPDQKLSILRKDMEELKLDAFIVFSQDSHNTEIPPTHDDRREFLTGFTGSAGDAVVTKDKAYLWTDGRYILQAAKELDTSLWEVKDVGHPELLHDWLNSQTELKTVGFDPDFISISTYKLLSNMDRVKKNEMFLKPEKSSDGKNLIDRFWTNQPPLPYKPIFILPGEGKSISSKRADILKTLDTHQGADALLLSTLDDVAWYLNLRGGDSPHSPLFVSYLLIGRDFTRLYIDSTQLNPEVKDYLDLHEVAYAPYDQITIDLKKMNKVLLENKASLSMKLAVGKEPVILDLSPVALAKSIKSPAEMEGIRESHVKDGVALCRYFHYLDVKAKDGMLVNQETEFSVAQTLDRFRAEEEGNKGISFDTISSTGANGAIIHYRPHENTASQIEAAMYLCDSGGQYLRGTTDVTRTTHFGSPTDEEKFHFTLVLQGFIDLAKAVFPAKTKGSQLDALARTPLWQNYKDFEHSTGHGVGYYLNVHEAPCAISRRTSGAVAETPFSVGSVTSIEPGYYAKGKFGIRHENLAEVIQVDENSGFLKFRQLTLVPFDTRLVLTEMLSNEQKKWLNEYHERVREVIGRELRKRGESNCADWVDTMTESIV